MEHDTQQRGDGRSHPPRRTTGFPSPAADFDETLDLNRLLITHPASTFFMIVNGQTMVGYGIRAGDILIVDRSVSVRPGRLIIAVLDGQMFVRFFLKRDRDHVFLSTDPHEDPISVTKEQRFEVWGCVSFIIHPSLAPFLHHPPLESTEEP